MAKKSKDIVFYVQKYFFIVAIFLIPISVCYELFQWFIIRWRYFTNKQSTKLKHHEKVMSVQKQVEDWKKSGSDRPMCTARPGWQSITVQRQLYKDKMHQIKIDMGEIVSLDETNKVVRVEPMVTIGTLNNFLISLGWTLPIVPELDDLTIGGLVMGGGIETTSHKYGLFHHVCRGFELVLGDGQRVWCSPTENQDLFTAQPFCYGTLGFLTCVDIDIVPFKPFIKLTYHGVQSLDQVVAKFEEETMDPENDSVEGIVYSKTSGVIMSGKFVDRVPSGAKYNAVSSWYKPWFYKHVAQYTLGKGQDNVEYVPTRDFYHRHNRALFWLVHCIVPFGNHAIFRYLFGWTMPPKYSFLKRIWQTIMRTAPPNVDLVLQDYILRQHDLKESLLRIDEEMKIYPIWLCPVKHIPHPEIQGTCAYNLIENNTTPFFVDVGVYGWSGIEDFEMVETQKRFEKFATDTGGFAALYAETDMTFQEYCKMFYGNSKDYDSLRKKWNCDKGFPHVYDKISKKGRSSGF